MNVSAINQYTYCPRRFGLIYLENEFSDNVYTARGNAEHKQVDHIGWITTREGARAEYALPIWSDHFGLIGKCDVVEFWLDGSIYPVEYKHGARKKRLNDDLQLAGQAMCLEEMTGRPVTHGAIYHHSSRRRREVIITAALRAQVKEAIAAIRLLLASGTLPPPVNDARCKECSLKDICQPEVLAQKSSYQTAQTGLFIIDD
ncbi:CRISPR-associated protein Cas4 [Nitrosomonas sp.]|uniref:CRISPR-associated protein Cas4 n=1 Tax=Nitrosomonas sp. TaxID=42353 RepID=UPI0037C6B0F1